MRSLNIRTELVQEELVRHSSYEFWDYLAFSSSKSLAKELWQKELTQLKKLASEVTTTLRKLKSS